MTLAASALAQSPRLGMQKPVALLGMALLAVGALVLGAEGWRFAALLVIGALLGMSLYHAAFGFTSAYRRAIVQRDVAGVIAQLVMLGVAMLLFAPVLAQGEAFGHGLSGAVAPASLQVAIGSLLFGLGMQLGGGCGSGTLYTVGGGSTRMVITLVAFCAGAFAGSLDMARYAGLPSLGSVSLAAELGYPLAIALQLGVLLAVGLALKRWAGDAPQRPLWQGLDRRRLLHGPWPLLFSALMLAVLNLATLLVAGHPWTVTWAFTLWGAKVAAALGWDPATSAFWTGGFPGAALERSILRDNISIMDLGIILGALTAAGLAGRFSPVLKIPLRSLLAAVIGGLLMGYGARLAFGCNIGAFFSGVASFSLHGWLWIVCALAGTWLGVRLRPLFGLGS
ncbi:MAG TPA: YeeE/YedE family protein [Geminicoccaceae bacterium]|nr:YeeE/YedE family protein [Geminicoccaceae bacterium]